MEELARIRNLVAHATTHGAHNFDLAVVNLNNFHDTSDTLRLIDREKSVPDFWSGGFWGGVLGDNQLMG